MVQVFVVYDTKHGNTRLVAEKITEAIGEVGGIEIAISDIEEVDLQKVADSETILVGSPNHMGQPARGIKKFIDKLGRIDLKAKWVAVFDTYLGEDFEKVVKKMEKRIGEKAPGPKLIASGLSIRVGAMKGPIVDGELPKCKNFGRKIANQLKKA